MDLSQIYEVTSIGRTEGGIARSEILPGFWLMDGEAPAEVGASPDDQLGPVCHTLKWRCL